MIKHASTKCCNVLKTEGLVQMVKKIKHKIQQINIDRKGMSSLEKSRIYFILEGITGIGQFSLSTGAYLAGFISFLGGSQTLNGTLGVIPPAVGIFQIFSTLLLRSGKSRKEQTLKIVVLLRLFLSCIYFVPFIFLQLGFEKSIVLTSFILCFIFAFSLNSLASPMISSWLIDIAPVNLRGRYFALRDKVSLGVIAFTTLVLGRVLDYQKALNHEFTGFLIVGLVLSVMGIVNIVAVLRIEDINNEVINLETKFIHQILRPLKDQIFRRVVMFYILWNAALFIGGPFVAVYMVERIQLSYTYMMAMSVLTTVIRVFVASRWGNYADRKSWFSAGGTSLLVLALCHTLWGFTTKSNSWILVPIVHIIGGIAWSGVAISLFNIQFLFAKKEIRTMSIGVNAAIGGIVSMIAVKIGGLIVLIEDFTLPIVHFKMSGMQLTFIASGFLIMCCTIYIKKVLEPFAHTIVE